MDAALDNMVNQAMSTAVTANPAETRRRPQQQSPRAGRDEAAAWGVSDAS
eukprot:CAMPEP_0119288742 /NCGR_PEP_ID=MMETSP1329-20130426/37802_1 /TAXON_ID=114041 /ORGANISM="Genus nov. species nov., Strain RCC1024" /LENGTH=49 /DNA_ID= /DNA_START= /DNA_END= /DNA_ORIENTATION=